MLSQDNAEPDRVGLCATCLHAQQVVSARESVFVLCGLALDDASFAKYPRLPMRNCSGFETAPKFLNHS